MRVLRASPGLQPVRAPVCYRRFMTAERQGYALLSIIHACVNRGNLIIEHAARRVLGLESPAVVIDVHQPLSQEAAAAASRCRAVVLPGATLLQPEDHASAAGLASIDSPLLAIGTALRSMDGNADLAVARVVRTVVGSRDPFTHDALTRAGLPSRLVGCPSLFLGDAQGWRPRTGPIVFSPGLGAQGPLEECARACASVAPTVLLQHAPARQAFDIPNVRAEPLTSAEGAIDLIRSASVVVTSRMHAFLVAMICGVPAVFLGGWYDSRYSLLEYLGVPIEPPVPQRLVKLLHRIGRGDLPPEVCFQRAQTLRESMRAWIEEVAEPLGLRLPSDLAGLAES